MLVSPRGFGSITRRHFSLDAVCVVYSQAPEIIRFMCNAQMVPLGVGEFRRPLFVISTTISLSQSELVNF